MLINALEIFTLMVVLILPLFYPVKKKGRSIRLPKNYNDTSDSRYAINENGYLEEIHNDKLSSHAQ
jgi:hypothetical protein